MQFQNFGDKTFVSIIKCGESMSDYNEQKSNQHANCISNDHLSRTNNYSFTENTEREGERKKKNIRILLINMPHFLENNGQFCFC